MPGPAVMESSSGVASEEPIDLELLGRVTPLLPHIVEHIFRMFDCDVEALQLSFDRCRSDLRIVGVNSLEVTEVVQKFFEVLCPHTVVAGCNAELFHD